MRIRADLVIPFLLLTVLMAMFAFATSSLTLKFGLGSADDGFFALIAKSFAMGAYGLPLSSNEVSLFDPYVGSGPVLIGIGALATYLLGPQDSLGLLTLIVFVLQLFLILFILSRRYSWAPILGATFTGLFLLILISGKQWYFGVFIGEVPAFGFVLLGTVLLGLEERRSWLVAAGISFAMAYLTKQISLFAVMGVILSWFVYMAANTDTRRAFNSFMVVIGSMAMLPLFYEGAKLITLGLKGYLGLWGRTIEETARMAIGEGDNRSLKFLDVISDNYGPIWLVAVVMFLFMAILAWQVFKNNKVAIFPLMLWSGAFSYFVYIAIASTMMPRYFWIGAAILVFAFGTTVLAVGTFVRWSVIVLLVAGFGFNVYANLDGVVKRGANESLSEERAIVLNEIAKYPDISVAGRSWHSFYDIVYLMESDRSWVTEERLHEIEGKDFVAILNAAFGDKAKFYNAVTDGCESLLVGKRYSIYACDNVFWKIYGDK